MRLPFTLYLFLLTINSYAQNTFETYTPANGLVDARVSGMVQDKYGRIIIYTREGFSIYDGQRFKNYLKIGEEEIGIVSGSMMLADSSLYLLRFNGNPIKVEKETISFDSSFINNLQEVSVVKQINRYTHFILSNVGIYILTDKKLKKLINKSKTHPIELKYAAFGSYHNNKLLLYINDGNSLASLVLYDMEKEAVVDQIDNFSLAILLQDNQGEIYFYNSSEIFQVDTKKLDENKIAFAISPLLNQRAKTTESFRLIFDSENNAWLINPDAGCEKINLKSGELKLYNYSNGLLKGITDLFLDNEKNYWFLMHGKGIQKMVQSKYEEVRSINGMPYHRNNFLHNLPDGSLFINGKEGKYSVTGNINTPLPNTSSNENTDLIYWQKKYWHFKTVNTLQSDKGEIVQFQIDSTKTVLAISSKIKTDTNGNLLIAGNVFYLLLKDGSFSAASLPYYTDNVIADAENNYWAFSRSDLPVIQFKYENNKLIKVNEYNSRIADPRCTAYWNKDTFLVGTRNNGLIFVKAKAGKIVPVKSLTREKGLCNNFIMDIVKLNQHKIAVATASGLNIIRINNKDTTVQDVSSVINVYDPLYNIAADNNENLYTISETTRSLFKYTNSGPEKASYIPNAFISSIAVNKQKISKDNTRFSFRENNFSFEIAAPSFIDNKNIQFIYFLSGRQNNQFTNNTGYLELNNLEAGSYKMKIKVVYPGNIYAEQTLFYNFTINNPFWKTWWFITSLIAFIAFLTWYLIRNFYRKKLQQAKILLEKELAIEQERSRMARELHDGLGSMLSGVKHSFDAMNRQMNLNEDQQILFHTNIDKLNETINELRAISHNMASDTLLKFGLQNSLLDYCKNINRSGEVKINFSAINMEAASVTEQQAFHIFRIVQELLANIVKHASASEAIVQISYNANRLYLTIEDNGKGFEINESRKKKSLGLKNIESRVRILKGKLDYQTAPAKGTSVLIEIPCKVKS